MLSPAKLRLLSPRRLLTPQFLALAVLVIVLLNVPFLLRAENGQHLYKWGWGSKDVEGEGSKPSPPSTSGGNHDDSHSQNGGQQKSENYHQGNHPPPPQDEKPQQEEIKPGSCASFPYSDRVVVTAKTGATESYSRIPILMETSLRCASKAIIFSDMAETIGNYTIHDALDTMPPSATDSNSDFDIYRKQQELKDPTLIMKELKGMKDPQRPGDLAAWTLDKYKFLHIIEKSWAMEPDADWYFHIDADTYIVWPSLLAWLPKMDPKKEAFIGSLSSINNKAFAHGGSGMLLSHAAMYNFAVEHVGTAGKWDVEMHENCCGDWVLAQILKEYGMEVMHAWPTIQGETPSTVPFAETHWCQPLVTMHHMSYAESKAFGEFEKKRQNPNEPLTYAELYFDHVASTIPSTPRSNWDNLSEDETLPASSPSSCISSCSSNPSCFQSLYKPSDSNSESEVGTCILSTGKFSLGEKVKNHEEEEEKMWISSWNRTRIAEWVWKQKECGEVVFPFTRK